MTEHERAAALELLQDPQLLARIAADYVACGLVGEETNKLVCYLAGVSRLLPRPLSVLIQSSSAAGKTALLEATLALMPPEAQLRWSALTSQSLYYLGRDELKHKILAVAEEEGVSEASYALKLLQSEGRLALAVATKESDTGRGRTEHYEVEGPVALLLTTTRDDPDSELANRCLVLSVNEDAQQTAAIHQRQRAAYSRDGAVRDAQAIRTRHQCAQRLLEPLGVVIPWAEQLTFPTDQTRFRRDHAKYLSLIASVTLLHQYQRQEIERVRDGVAERCVVATQEDVAVANRLATAVLVPRPDALLPQTRQLLEQLRAYVTERSACDELSCSTLRFSQRELRAALGWQDRALRRQLARLVELEYLVVHRTGHGNQKVYQWWSTDVADTAEAATHWGLVDAAHLSRRAPR